MNTQKYSLPVLSVCIWMVLMSIEGCKNDSGSSDAWVESRDVSIMAYKSDPKDGKQFLDVIYENIGSDTYRKIKYQLFTRTGTTLDTIEKTIIPETVFKPKDRRLVPRHIGQEEAKFDEVKAGKVWVVLDSK